MRLAPPLMKCKRGGRRGRGRCAVHGWRPSVHDGADRLRHCQMHLGRTNPCGGEGPPADLEARWERALRRLEQIGLRRDGTTAPRPLLEEAPTTPPGYEVPLLGTSDADPNDPEAWGALDTEMECAGTESDSPTCPRVAPPNLSCLRILAALLPAATSRRWMFLATAISP